MITIRYYSRKQGSALTGLLVCAALAGVPGRGWSGPGAERRLTPEQAVARALKHNLGLEVERLSPTLSDTAEDKADSAFEPELFAKVDGSYSPGQVSSQRAGLSPTSSTRVGAQVGMRKDFSTGTSVALSLANTALFASGSSLDPSYQSSLTLTATQSLLDGISRSANELQLQSARLERTAAQRALERKVEKVAGDTLSAYFDLHSALAKDAVQQLAVTTAETTLNDSLLLIRAGKVAGAEELSARYTLHVQRRNRLQTVQAVADARDKLARLVGMVEPSSLATPTIVTVETTPAVPADSALKGLQTTALSRRGDYLEALETVKVRQLRTRALRHRLLPKLDLSGSLFLTGLSGEFTGSGAPPVDEGYWSSYKMDRVGWSAGLNFAMPLFNLAAQADLRGAELELRRAERSAELVLQSISQELNVAWRAVRMAQKALELTRAAGRVAQGKLKNEEARYRAGKTTAHILATVQAETIKELHNQAQAQADLNKALVKLHTTAGDLLSRLKLNR